MTNIQLKNSLINSAAYVDLGCTGFTWSSKRLNRAEPVIGQNPSTPPTGLDDDLHIPQGDEIGGVEPPVLVIRGAIDVERFATDNALHDTSGITEVTLGYLKELWRVKSAGVTTIQIYFGMDNSKEFRAYDGGDVTGTSKRDITVLVESLDITPMEDSEGLHMIRYQLQLREVRV